MSSGFLTFITMGGRAIRFQTRWRDHLRSLMNVVHENSHMQAVYNKYGQFIPTILVQIEDTDSMFEAEQRWLDENFRKPGCLNLSPHADGGCVSRSEETRKKMSQTRSSRPDLIQKSKDSMKLNGIPFVKGERKSEVMIRKAADGHRGKKQSSDHIAKRVAAHLGRRNTLETKAQMSESAKKRANTQPTKHGSETRALISTQQKGRIIWVNNGTSNTRIWPNEFSEYEASGFMRGRKGM